MARPLPSRPAAPANKEELLEEFQALVRDTEVLLQHSASLVGDQAEELRAQIRDSLGRARSTLKNTEENVVLRGKAAVGATEDYVQTHPWQTIGIAAGIGILIGMLISRR
ncbi:MULTISPECIES: YqjD family protein [Pseudomonas]|uniref:ElaB/YqjD/DUF883 family membrane-anchored ribosome-binding protein n=2 Tax=Pseudomonadaceae TaxID=135621 RepID=A0A1G8C4T0_9GAMM|nr:MULTISPECIES: YqjD family protein [Pseudomonas]KIP96674.1 membrane protein [Pseudomonas fulva]MCW2291992.1 ElaB/YqjD/DUF883 family membrane-anchored ribosome-binding protein [Pseudomonas sp. BIGb0408]NYH73437.1 ElaB/YqjD/DUF883 family membrane-anchored ribosome-binding protein [Pseudomonas flavescens]UCJ15075.1 YqjD family protein [Pseudomonas sp. MM211]SDH40318.1 Membrane-anchored ribosome-binding protein, inhibits growth in stationary phase, ElaB/YqjD/DUF883 family [Pseudomonas flavescens